MSLEKLKKELSDAREQLKDYNKFIDLMRIKDDPKGILTRLNKTIGRIEMLVNASEIKEFEHPSNEALKQGSGKLVSIRPCDEKYGNKTYVGFYLGELSLGSSIQITDENKIQCNWSGYNPAIFVPELGEVIMGCASWWQKIKSVEQLKEITDDDIENVWYMKLMKEQLSKNNTDE
jgi:uncharacterized protein YjiS (DUF1127 family)